MNPKFLTLKLSFVVLTFIWWATPRVMISLESFSKWLKGKLLIGDDPELFRNEALLTGEIIIQEVVFLLSLTEDILPGKLAALRRQVRQPREEI